MSEYIDITIPVSNNALTYPGDPECSISPYFSIKKGDEVNMNALAFGAHTGTHVDAPYHIFDDGKKLHELSFKHFLGNAKVFDLSGIKRICRADLEDLTVEKNDIVFLKTSNSAFLQKPEFFKDYVYIMKEAALLLKQRGIATLGFDYMTVDKFGSLDVHRELLGADIAIIEGLDLSRVQQGIYEVISLPLNIEDADGAPLRVLLKRK